MIVKFGCNVDKKFLNKAKSGKEKFLIRLAQSMKDLGVNVCDKKKSDVFIRLAGQKIDPNTKLNVLRLNGLWFNKEQPYKKRNKAIVNSIKKSDALIYQGEFCMKAYETFLEINGKLSDIIPNGADPNCFDTRRTPSSNFFLALCKWRPHKRLKTIIDSFILANEMGLDSDLIVIGTTDHIVKNDRIRYLGWQDNKKIVRLLSKAIASLHLTYLDWCPNAMIESIVANCPLIYTSSGGHSELGRGMGISIQDSEWDCKHAIQLYNPPLLDLSCVAKAMIEIKNNGYNMDDNVKFHIDSVAKKYIDFFERCL